MANVSFHWGTKEPSSSSSVAGGIYVDSNNKCIYAYSPTTTKKLTFKHTLPFMIRPTLNDYTWEEISRISRMGLASEFFSVGDTKTSRDASGEQQTYTFCILGFNHDDLADGSGKAGITFGITHDSVCNLTSNITETVASPVKIYSSLSSSYTNLYGFVQYNALQNYIRPVTKEKYCWTTTAIKDTTSTSENLFALSSREVLGSTGTVECGTQYEYFKTPQNIANYTNKYWLRDSSTYSSVNYLQNSQINSINYSSTSENILFGFCL